MAGKNWQAGGKNLIPARALLCLIVAVAPVQAAWALSDNFAPPGYLGSIDPDVVWELPIGGAVVCSSLGAIALWICSASRRSKRSDLRKGICVSSALNNRSHGVMMT